MSSFEKIIHFISRCLNWIAGISVIAIMVIVCINVIGRSVFGMPLKGTVDILSQMGVLVIACAIAYTQVVKGHIRITILLDRLPGRVSLFINIIMDILGVILFFIITWQSILYTKGEYEIGELTEVLRMPVMPFAAIVSLGCLALTLVLVTDLVRLVSGGKK
ncbi:MAG: TRAP transporter small permease [Deltaproteobacteria bacterium]|nr:TRAP transporter small permease [Deltaproteobacteria bacterium]